MASNGIIGQRRFLVTLQAMFVIPARTEQEAENMVVRAVNIGVGMAPSMAGMGVVAETLTQKLLEERGLTKEPKPDLSV